MADEEDKGLKDIQVFDGENWVSISDVSAEGKYVKIDGTSSMTNWLKTPGIQGRQIREANVNPDKPIDFIEVIEGGPDGGDITDDYTQWMCSGHILMGYVGGNTNTQGFKIKNLKTCEDSFDAANKKYVDDEVSKVTGSVTSVNGKTGVVVLDVKSLSDVCETDATDGQVLVWKDGLDGEDGKWCPATPSAGGSTTLSGLTDVCDTTPSDNHVLTWNKDGGADGTGEWCAEAAPVTSVNGKTGVVNLTASDVNAKPDSYEAPVTSVNGKTGVVNLTASDVNAKPDSYEAPVTSVNGKTGVVNLTASDVGAKPDSYEAPVTSVNGETGVVNLDVKSLSDVCDTDAADGHVLTWKDGLEGADGQWCASALPTASATTLPISDENDTVTLKSPSDNNFVIETKNPATNAYQDRFLIKDDGNYLKQVGYDAPAFPDRTDAKYNSPNVPDTPEGVELGDALFRTDQTNAITNVLRLYSATTTYNATEGPVNSDQIGFGVTASTCHIAACDRVNAMRFWVIGNNAMTLTGEYFH